MSLSLAEKPVLRGSQVPRVFHAPEFDESAGAEAVAIARSAGLVLDPWQEFVLHHGLGERDGRWAAFRVGVCVPRQNGKGGIIEALELAALFVFRDRLVTHSAHEFATSREALFRLEQLIQNTPELHKRVRAYKHSHGEEGIYLKSGQRIHFRTRTGGGGRGFSGDKVILDEAMYLPPKVMSALVPTMSARINPQLWFFGSAVDQVEMDHGVEFARVREQGLQGSSGSLAYFEWSVDANNPDELSPLVSADPELWAESNPAMGIRISEEYIRDERDTLPWRGFAVERLGVGDWPTTDESADRVVDPRVWAKLADEQSKIDGAVWFALDVTPDRARATICAAGRRSDGLFHVEVAAKGRGTGWLADKAAQLVADHKPVAFVCDQVGPAASLIPELERAGVKVETLSTQDHAQACAFLFDQVEQDRVRHLGTDDLTAAVRGAVTRPLGDAWAWSRKNSSVDISPLVASTFALWAAGLEREREVLVAWA